jgi:hypothetical protein
MIASAYTGIYFSDEENDRDPLSDSAEENGRQTLIAERQGGKWHHSTFRHHAGEKETVFCL